MNSDRINDIYDKINFIIKIQIFYNTRDKHKKICEYYNFLQLPCKVTAA